MSHSGDLRNGTQAPEMGVTRPRQRRYRSRSSRAQRHHQRVNQSAHLTGSWRRSLQHHAAAQLVLVMQPVEQRSGCGLVLGAEDGYPDAAC